MSRFVCRIGTPDGQVRVEVLEGDTLERVQKELSQRGYYIFSIKKQGFRLPSLKRKKSVKPDIFLVFNQELAALLKAGLPLTQAVDILLERQANPTFRAILGDVAERLRSGEALSDIFSDYTDQIPILYPTTLMAGERSGELEKMIHRFVAYQKVILEVQRKVKGSLIYPAILFSLSIILVIIMVTYVIPRFTSFYADFAVNLPFLTLAIINLSKFVTRNGYLIAGGAILGFMVFYSWSHTPEGRRHWHRFLLSLPLLGRVLRLFSLSQFLRALATLIAGGTAVIQALRIAMKAVGNQFISYRIQQIIPKVEEGGALWAALEDTGVFTSIAIEMSKVGEATGNLQEMLHHAANFYDEEIDTKLHRILTVVEPLMLVFMGVIVATLLAAVYIPLLTLIGKVK